MKHTKGPWQVTKRHSTTMIADHYGIVATIEPQLESSCLENANASLISAAPEMLEALQACFELITSPETEDHDAYQIEALIKNVIKKAKGE